jgi:glycosyltransferase involved in cell wall biosynthesis
MSSVSVILPSFNEEATLPGIIARIRALSPDWEIVVVDDGSKDRTAEVADKAGAVVVRHPYNLGNGMAVKSGARAASRDILVYMDADGQHLPEDIPKLLRHMDRYDMVVGARTNNCDVSRFRTVGNRMLIRLAEILSGHDIPDLTSGFRAIKRDVFMEFIHLLPNKYSYPTTITMSLLKVGHFVHFEPLDTIGRRQAGTSSIRPFQDGLRFINIMLRIVMLFSPQKIFVPISAFFFFGGVFWGIYSVLSKDKLIQTPVLFITVGLGLFLFGLLADQIASIRRELRPQHQTDHVLAKARK